VRLHCLQQWRWPLSTYLRKQLGVLHSLKRTVAVAGAGAFTHTFAMDLSGQDERVLGPRGEVQWQSVQRRDDAYYGTWRDFSGPGHSSAQSPRQQCVGLLRTIRLKGYSSGGSVLLAYGSTKPISAKTSLVSGSSFVADCME